MTTPNTPDAGAHPYFDQQQQPPEQQTGQLVPLTNADVEQLLQPYTIDARTWLQGLMTNDDFPEQDAEAMTIGILASILQAESSDAALTAMNVLRARDLCGNEPGGRSDVLQVLGARPLKSDYADGAACYCIIDAVILKDGERVKITTGAKAVQAVVLKHWVEGWMPFKCALEIRRERTKAGYYPLNMVAGV